MEMLPKSESHERVKRLQKWMQQTPLDAVFVLQSADLYYFAGTVQIGLLCLPSAGDPVFLVQKSLTRARLESPLGKLVPLGSFKKVPEILAGEGILALKRVGLEQDVLPASLYLRLRDLFPATEFIDASDAIRRIRMIKSPHEVEQIRHAARMLKAAFQELPGWIRPGITELEVMARLEGFLRMKGHQGLTRMRGFNYEISYGTISSGPSASHPTYFPGPVGFEGLYPAVPNGGGTRRMTEGDTVIADIVGGYGGYIADKTRTFAIGEIAPCMAQAHAFVLELMSKVKTMLKPGTSCEHIFQCASGMVEKSPYAEGFMGSGDSQVRFLGHGVGLELDELPVLASGFEIPLEAGMTIAIEPKIFFAGRGGVGIENTYLITETGYENLTEFPEGIIPAGK
jgi:Xaa-Pro aminopeptidase